MTNQTSVATEPINLRDTASAPGASGNQHFKRARNPPQPASIALNTSAAAIEDDANERDMPHRVAVEPTAVEWCENQNKLGCPKWLNLGTDAFGARAGSVRFWL